MSLDVDVPPNVTATVAIPVEGEPPSRPTGRGDARFEGYRDGRAVFTIGPGEARFDPR